MAKRASSAAAAAAASKRARGASLPVVPGWFHEARARVLRATPATEGACVLYWMNRDQRARDNYALLYAKALAENAGVPLVVVFHLVDSFGVMNLRHYGFCLRGLMGVEAALDAKGIPFHLTRGDDPAAAVVGLAARLGAAAVVADMDPLREPRAWVERAAAALEEALPAAALIQVDAHNVVPVWHVTDKQEVGARTLRPRINRMLHEFLVEYPELTDQSHPAPPELHPERRPAVTPELVAGLDVDRSVPELAGFPAGEAAAQERFDAWVTGGGLRGFKEHRNNPTRNVLSHMAPYIRFGQVSVQSLARQLRDHGRHRESADCFVEEAVVRRELSDNYVWFNEHYDSLEGAAGWARETLRVHAADPREHVYSGSELEAARTHDDLWNAAQLQLAREGKMHGFLRMYWAKKILEWTSSPEEALRTAIYLNDKYSLDGLCPNGYVGCMWSIAGVHDQGWAERPVFGKIRYMNYAGCKRKFRVAEFVAKYPAASANAAAVAAKARNSK